MRDQCTKLVRTYLPHLKEELRTFDHPESSLVGDRERFSKWFTCEVEILFQQMSEICIVLERPPSELERTNMDRVCLEAAFVAFVDSISALMLESVRVTDDDDDVTTHVPRTGADVDQVQADELHA